MEKFMKVAIKEAIKAYNKGEVPVGACIVYDNKIIAKAHNLRESKQSGIMHAEIIAIDKACKALGSWRLDECEMYVTLEPCIMCSGAIIQSRIKKVVYGAKDTRWGACGSYINVFENKFNHIVEIESGTLENECSGIIKQFFMEIRKDKTK